MSIFVHCTHFRTTPEWNPADAVSAAVVGDSRSSHRHVCARPAPGTATLSVRVRAVGSSRVSEPAPGVADTCVEAAAVGVAENTGARPRPLGEALCRRRCGASPLSAVSDPAAISRTLSLGLRGGDHPLHEPRAKSTKDVGVGQSPRKRGEPGSLLKLTRRHHSRHERQHPRTNPQYAQLP